MFKKIFIVLVLITLLAAAFGTAWYFSFSPALRGYAVTMKADSITRSVEWTGYTITHFHTPPCVDGTC